MRSGARLPLWALLGAALASCAPALDWREIRLEAAGLQALFPCRPVGRTRQVELAGRPVAMQLQACEAGGHTFAIGLADLHDPAAVGPALRALRAASDAKAAAGPQLGPATPPASQDAPAAAWPAPPGATPQAAAGRWQWGVPGPKGERFAMDTAVFARGTWVVQASVIGPEPGPGATLGLAPFFDGLRFTP